MYRILLMAAVISIAVCSCKDTGNKQPETSMDAARNFIRASLDGDFKTAESLLLKDSANIDMYENYKRIYSHFSDETRKQYKESSYMVNKMEEVNDSVTIINYSNSYMKKPQEIKVVRQLNSWKIDFKYTLSGNLPID